MLVEMTRKVPLIQLKIEVKKIFFYYVVSIIISFLCLTEETETGLKQVEGE